MLGWDQKLDAFLLAHIGIERENDAGISVLGRTYVDVEVEAEPDADGHSVYLLEEVLRDGVREGHSGRGWLVDASCWGKGDEPRVVVRLR